MPRSRGSAWGRNGVLRLGALDPAGLFSPEEAISCRNGGPLQSLKPATQDCSSSAVVLHEKYPLPLALGYKCTELYTTPLSGSQFCFPLLHLALPPPPQKVRFAFATFGNIYVHTQNESPSLRLYHISKVEQNTQRKQQAARRENASSPEGDSRCTVSRFGTASRRYPLPHVTSLRLPPRRAAYKDGIPRDQHQRPRVFLWVRNKNSVHSASSSSHLVRLSRGAREETDPGNALDWPALSTRGTSRTRQTHGKRPPLGRPTLPPSVMPTHFVSRLFTHHCHQRDTPTVGEASSQAHVRTQSLAHTGQKVLIRTDQGEEIYITLASTAVIYNVYKS